MVEASALDVRISTKEALRCKAGEEVTLLGWVSSKSIIGGIVFTVLRDGGGYIQLAGKKGLSSPDTLDAMRKVTLESAVMASGRIRDDARAPGGREVSVSTFKILQLSEQWPITKSAQRSSSFLYDKRHLSIRGRKSIAAMKIRGELIGQAFDFFTKRGFTFINAPTIVQSACEGGATLFPLDYFGQKAFLTQSAQFYEEAAICAFDKVFIIQPAFRAEKSKTSRHLTEFWMIEAEQAFATQEDNMRLQEELLAHLLRGIAENCGGELRLLGRKARTLELPLPRIGYDEVVERAGRAGLALRWGDDLSTEVERFISKSSDVPFFVTDYPLSARSFYHTTRPDDDRVTLSADLLAPEGYGEMATGGQRTHDIDTLTKRIQKEGIPEESIGWYLELRKYGLPPHSGFGLGVERAVRWIAGLRHIRAASLFPRTMTRANP